MSQPAYAIVGRVRKAHGVRGELVVEAFTNAPVAIFAAGRRVFGGTSAGVPLPADPQAPRGVAGAPLRELTIERATPFKGGWIVQLSGLRDRDEAERWRERTLLLPMHELPPPAPDEVYFHDLVGMRVALADGEATGAAVGEIVGLYELPHGLMLEIRRHAPATGTVLVPYRPEMVRDVDEAARLVTIQPPDGLLE